MDAGLNDADAPLGRPDALRATLCAAPLVIAVEIVEVPLWPAVTVMVVGAAEIEKSGGGGAPTVLKNATPADQYIAAEKLPAIDCGAGAPRF